MVVMTSKEGSRHVFPSHRHASAVITSCFETCRRASYMTVVELTIHMFFPFSLFLASFVLSSVLYLGISRHRRYIPLSSLDRVHPVLTSMARLTSTQLDIATTHNTPPAYQTSQTTTHPHSDHSTRLSVFLSCSLSAPLRLLGQRDPLKPTG
jgi:hypothetical protein